MTIVSDPAVLKELARAARRVEEAQKRVDQLTLVRDVLTVDAVGKVNDLDASKALGLETAVDQNGRVRCPAYWKRVHDMRRKLEAEGAE
jgi:hypothetical protein